MSHGARPVEAVGEALLAIGERESTVHAFAYLDADRALVEAGRAPQGALYGLTAGVKDIFDTGDQPTEYGSSIFVGHQPRADAAAVALLRAAGAVVLGKTVTAELAWSTPGETTNPHRVSHTPGGSSSGSAAAVAAGMVDLAIGTQTAGSVIRPASFCGVFGLKPTFGLIPTAGMKPGAPSLDTIGVFAADLGLLEIAAAVLMHRKIRSSTSPLSFGLLRTDLWSDANADCQEVVESAATLLEARDLELPAALTGLANDVEAIQAYEGARSLAWERHAHPDQLSVGLRERLEWGDSISEGNYDDVRGRVAHVRTPAVVEALFGANDVLVTPAATGEAPEGLDSTGDPKFCRLWTALGFPTLSVPGYTGATGLPIGIQLVARPCDEGLLIRAGKHLTQLLA